MTSEPVKRAAEAFAAHDAFAERDERAYEATATSLDATVEISETEDGERGIYLVTVEPPTLDAVVEEAVAPVVADGWYETFERRLADAHTVARTETADPPEVRRADETVVVELTFGTDDPADAPDDAQAIIEYVEGTWMQGLVPGYEYREPAKQMLERAQQDDGQDPSITPS